MQWSLLVGICVYFYVLYIRHVMHVLTGIGLYWKVRVCISMYCTYLYVLACIACNGLYVYVLICICMACTPPGTPRASGGTGR